MKVRPRCEAPRRDIVYPMNYTPCRFVRISCLRGNPISIFFIQVNRKFRLKEIFFFRKLGCRSNEIEKT